jgi:predicted nucleic acid-binding protein
MSNARSKESSESRRVVINDASCLIDLHKVGLVEVMLQLPYDFVVPLPVTHNEVLDFTKADWSRFSDAGLGQVDLDPGQVGRAMTHRSQYSKLTAEDCFSLVLAEDIKHSILLTGDAELRNVASGKGCEVHGVIWVADQIHSHGLIANLELAERLEVWLNDPLVRLPTTELNARLRLLRSKTVAVERAEGDRPAASPQQRGDRYFRTEKEVMNDDQSLPAVLAKGGDNRRILTGTPRVQVTTQKIGTSAPGSLDRKKDPKLNYSQPNQELPEPLPYFVREVGAPLEKPRSPIGKLRYPRGKKR